VATNNLANDPAFRSIVRGSPNSKALSFTSNVVQDGATQGVAYLNGAMSFGTSNTVRQFTKKVTTALSVTRKLGSAYAKMNVLEAISQRKDPVNNFEWLAVVVPKKLNANATVPWYYIDGISVPSMSFSTNEKFVNGKTNKYAGTFSVDTCSMKIYSDVTGIGFDFCNDWFRSIYRDDGLYQPPSLYKRNVYIYILDPARGIVVDFKLVDVWPTAMATYELDSGAAHALETQLTLSVDDLKMNYDSDPQSILNSVNRALGGVYDSALSTVSAGISNFFS
jgi:hypothetical protein